MNPPPAMAPARRAAIRRRLLAWYDQNKRDLPWRRRSADAYAQWVAEVMLQQTRVETVIPYYQRFLRKFPNLKLLARAEIDEVLPYWQGLGYYRRIHNLHIAVRWLDGRNEDVPRSESELRGLPGVGAYTAAAIASITFGAPCAAVDGNVLRVLSRLSGWEGGGHPASRLRLIQPLAQALLDPRRPGEFNQAWMDLGSLVCTVRAPKCDRCPLRGNCRAYRAGLTTMLKAIHRRPAVKSPATVRMLTAFLVCNGRWLVRKRPAAGLWSGLWEFPTITLEHYGSTRRGLNKLFREEGVVPMHRTCASGTLTHRLTHRILEIELLVCSVRVDRRIEHRLPRKWSNDQELIRLPLSTAHRRAFQAVCNNRMGDPIAENGGGR